MSDYIDEAFDSDEVWKKNGALRKASKEIERLREREARLREALHNISLCSQNSMSSKEECGRIARAALEEQEKK